MKWVCFMMVVIAHVFAKGDGFCQMQNESPGRWEDIIFSDRYFSEKYFRHAKIEKSGFFIKENEQSKKLVEGNTNVIDLKSGYFVAVVANGYLFAWGIENYIEIEAIVIGDRSISINYSLRESNGFKETVLCQKEVLLTKKGDDWVVSEFRDSK